MFTLFNLLNVSKIFARVSGHLNYQPEVILTKRENFGNDSKGIFLQRNMFFALTVFEML